MWIHQWGRGSLMPFEAHCARANRSGQRERESSRFEPQFLHIVVRCNCSHIYWCGLSSCQPPILTVLTNHAGNSCLFTVNFNLAAYRHRLCNLHNVQRDIQHVSVTRIRLSSIMTWLNAICACNRAHKQLSAICYLCQWFVIAFTVINESECIEDVL